MADVWDQFPDRAAALSEPKDPWAAFPDAPAASGSPTRPSAAASPASLPALTPYPHSDGPADPVRGCSARRSMLMNSALGAVGAPRAKSPSWAPRSGRHNPEPSPGSRREPRDCPSSSRSCRAGRSGGGPARLRLLHQHTRGARAALFRSAATDPRKGRPGTISNDRFGNRDRSRRDARRRRQGSPVQPPGDRYGRRRRHGAAACRTLPAPSSAVPQRAGICGRGRRSALRRPRSVELGGAQLFGESVGRLFPENRAAEPEHHGRTCFRAPAKELTHGCADRCHDGRRRPDRERGPEQGPRPVRAERRPIRSRPNSAPRPIALRGQSYDVRPLPSEQRRRLRAARGRHAGEAARLGGEDAAGEPT